MQKRISIVGYAVVVAFFGLAVCFFPAEAQALELYDDFDGIERLDPDLWHASIGDFRGGLDVVREVQRSKSKKDKDDGKLRMGATAYSEEGGGFEFGTRFNNPDGGGSQNITAMEAEVKITECEFTACGEEWNQIAEAGVEFLGSFFSTGLASFPPDCTEDFDEVHAAISLRRTPEGDGNMFHVWGRIYRHPHDGVNDYMYDLETDLGWIVEKKQYNFRAPMEPN